MPTVRISGTGARLPRGRRRWRRLAGAAAALLALGAYAAFILRSPTGRGGSIGTEDSSRDTVGAAEGDTRPSATTPPHAARRPPGEPHRAARSAGLRGATRPRGSPPTAPPTAEPQPSWESQGGEASGGASGAAEGSAASSEAAEGSAASSEAAEGGGGGSEAASEGGGSAAAEGASSSGNEGGETPDKTEEQWNSARAITALYDADVESAGDAEFFDSPYWQERPGLSRLLRRYQAFHRKHSGSGGVLRVRPVGQLCNRLMAISSGFIIALLTRRALSVDDSGFYASLNDLFVEPGFPWLRRPGGGAAGALIANPVRPPWRDTEPLLCQNLSKVYPVRGDITLSMNQYIGPYMTWNPHYRAALMALFGPDSGHGGPDVFGPVARFLFRPVKELQRMRDDFVQRHFTGYRVAGLQVRSGQDFTSHFMGKADWELYGRCGREGLPADGSAAESPVRYFVATDTEQGREVALQYLGKDKVIFGPGPFLRSNNPRGVRMALLDVLLLASADSLVTTAWSSFGYMAAGLRGRLGNRLVTDVVPGGERPAPKGKEQFYMGVPHKSDRRVACKVLPTYQPCFHKFANWGAQGASCFREEMIEQEMLGGRYC